MKYTNMLLMNNFYYIMSLPTEVTITDKKVIYLLDFCFYCDL